MKKLVSFVLALVLAASLLPVQAWGVTVVASGNCGKNGGNVTCTLDSDGVLTISGTGAMAAYEVSYREDGNFSSAPWYSRQESIRQIQILNGVTSIGEWAFYGCWSSLTSVSIPNSVTSIGDAAFSDCQNLTNVRIPDSITFIGGDAFSGCSSLTSVSIPDSVLFIGENVFSRCEELQVLSVDSQNPNYLSQNNVLFTKDMTQLINYPSKKDGDRYIIPSSVASIGICAFDFCSNLTSVTIPDSVTSIGALAFDGCSSLTSVSIGNGVTSIRGGAFSCCSGLTSITIPDSVTYIGEGAFAECSNLTNVNIPDSVTSIEGLMFHYCSSLTSVSIPDSVTSIGDTAFYGCSSLTDIYYGGSEEQWKAITIGGNNDCLTSATIHYNSTGPEGGSSDPTATENITLMWEKTGWPIKKDDTSKPPYPNGTDAQYAEALRAWAQNANIRSITQSNAETLLEQPVYIPVDTTGNGDYLLLSDGNTNVRQAIEDIVFLENLSNYVAELDEEIAGVTFGVAAGQTFAGYSMKQEKDIYRKALSWNAQIQKYLDKRNQNSNMYTASLAAQAYLD